MNSVSRANTIQRPRLLEKIHRASHCRITLISAPPGFGKTVLAEQFAQTTTDPLAWHAIEERERDLPNLYAQSVAALEAITPGIKTLVKPFDASAADLASFITNYLREHLTTRFFYVLDDLHFIEGAPAAENWLNALIELIPPNGHLILISRNNLKLPLDWITRGQVLIIDQDDLRLTDDELRQLAAQALGMESQDYKLTEIQTRLGGWPAGAVLALYPFPLPLRQVVGESDSGPEAVFNALAEAMLSVQPPAIRNFVLAASTLAHMTPELCNSVLGIADSRELLNVVLGRNLFVSQKKDGMIFHTLFRDFLQGVLKKSDPVAFAQLHEQAASWFVMRDDIESAFVHFMWAGQLAEAVNLVERTADGFYAEGKVETLLSWLRTLRQIGAQSGKLLTNCASLYIDRYDYTNATICLQEAAKLFERDPQEAGLARVQFFQAMIEFQRGKLLEAIHQAQTLLTSTLVANYRGGALTLLGLSHLELGELNVATRYFQEALPLYQAHSSADARAKLLQNLSVAYERAGNLPEARASLQEAVALLRSLKGSRALAMALNNLGFYFYLSGDYQEAQKTFDEGLALIAGTPNRRTESYLLWSLGDLERDIGLMESAMKRYYKALEFSGTDEPFLRCSVLVSLAQLQRWQEKYSEALTTARDVLRTKEVPTSSILYNLSEALIVACQAELDPLPNALEQMDSILSTFDKQGAKLKRLLLLGISAHVALITKGKRSARRYFKAALKLAEELNTFQYLAAECLHSERLYSTFHADIAKHMQLGKTIQVLQALRAAGTTDPILPRIQLRTVSLEVFTLGQFKVRRDGEVVPLTAWQAASARELFLYLLFEGSQSKEQIGSIFWGDLPTGKVRNNFHTSLRRAREALGENVLAFSEGKYLIAQDVGMWCDAREMESFVEKARHLPTKDARTEDLLRKAIDLYQGEFLPQTYMDWIGPYRLTYQNLYIEGLLGLAQCRRAWGDFHTAIQVLHQALLREPYREDIHRLLMVCYAEIGQRQTMIAHFHELRRLLWQDLSIEPAPETVSLMRQLLSPK